MNALTVGYGRERLFQVLLLFVSVIVALLLSEAVLQLVIPNGYYIWPPHIDKVFMPQKDITPGISGPSRFITSSIGMRAGELTPSKKSRILALGGSTTECLYLDQYETWPHLLQEFLKEKTKNKDIWVGNAGMSGRTIRHHITAMQFLPLREMKIDTVIVLVGVNDFSRRLSQEENYDVGFMTKPEATKILFSETFTGGSHADPDEPFFKKTAVWQLARKVKGTVGNNKSNVQDDEGRTLMTWRKHRQQAIEIRNELPNVTSALAEYSVNINRLVDISRENSVRLVLLTQPTLWKPNLPEKLEALLWLGGIGDFQIEPGKPYYSSTALEEGIRKYNDTLLDICRGRQLECIDLASILEKDTTVFYDDVHFNESGALKVAKILSDYFLSHGPFIAPGITK